MRKARDAAFQQGLQQLGWTDRPQRTDRLLAGARAMPTTLANMRRNWPPSRRTSFWSLAASVEQVLQATRTVPIVFAVVPDPVGSGFVASLAQPGGNATGFIQFEYSLTGKWLELLKQIAPGRDASGGPLGSQPHPPESASSL